ncbi:uncharacterized protein METZ01_LOCUS162069 [marine metagenome]|uniref:Uncharacterized protein n=1 Tax=marine metagenome TaxID=408172 RepID=A0A382B621_9ZZZZ
MDYHPVSCNRKVPLVSRGAFGVCHLSPGRETGSFPLDPKKAGLAWYLRVAFTRNVSFSRPACIWSGAETSQIPHAYVVLTVACAVLQTNLFSMN